MKRARIGFSRILLGIFFPERCPFCDKVVNIGEGVCEACRADLPRQPEPICPDCGQSREQCKGNCRAGYADGLTAPYVYRGVVRDAILRFKHGATALSAQAFAADMAETVTRQWPERTFDAVTFVPMTRREVHRREYNQSEWLAREVARCLNLPVWSALQKPLETRPQKSLPAEQRAGNVRGTMEVSKPYRECLKGAHLLLVDDLATTGSTIQECALMLKLYGAESVHAVTLARTWQHDENEGEET